MSQFIIDMSKKNLTIIVFDDKFKTLLQLTEIQFKDRLHLLSADMIKLGGDDIEAVQEDMRQYLIKSAHLLTLEPRRKFLKKRFLCLWGCLLCQLHGSYLVVPNHGIV